MIRSSRRTVLAAVVVVIALAATIVLGLLRTGVRSTPLEPDSPGPAGSRAIVRVLEQEGADVQTVRRTADAADALRTGRVVVVNAPDALADQQLKALRTAENEGNGRLVLVAPGKKSLDVLAPTIRDEGRVSSSASPLRADPSCGDASLRARSVDARPMRLDERTEGSALSGIGQSPDGTRELPSRLYDVGPAVPACFRAHGGGPASIVRQGDTIVLGTAAYLANDRILDADDAAVAMNALGAGTQDVTWYLPSAADPLASPDTLGPLLPDWLGPVLLWCGVVVLLALIVAGRRLGPVVIEPLPVRVRAQETVLGRARLLEKTRERERSALALRDAAAGAIAAALSVPAADGLDALVAAAADRSSRPPQEIRELLSRRPIRTDRDLVRLADDLDRLTKEIRR